MESRCVKGFVIEGIEAVGKTEEDGTSQALGIFACSVL
jgi:hypothetical protein